MIDERPTSVTETLRLTSLGARAIFALFLGVHMFIAIVNLGDVKSPSRTVVALVVLTIAAVVLTQPSAEPYPLPQSVLVIACATVISVLVDWNLPDAGFTGYASWQFGADTLLLVILALRGRSTLAWVGWIIQLGVAIVWGLSVGRPLIDPLSAMSTHAGTLLVGSLFALGIRRTNRRTAQLHTEQATLVALEAAANASLEEQTAQSEFLEQVARPAIERIASSEPFTPAERRHWLDLEASIRDSLRAAALMVPEVVAAAARARDRGVTVTLMDDSADAPLDSRAMATVVERVVVELDSAAAGELTARVLPSDREHLATIVIETEGDTRVVEVLG